MELGGAVLHSDVVDLGASVLSGVHRLEAQGEAYAPLLSRSDAVWSFFAGLGIQGQARVSASATVLLGVRALLLTPRPGVGLGHETAILEAPLLHAAAGLAMAL